MISKPFSKLTLLTFALMCMALWPAENSAGSAPTVSSFFITPTSIDLIENSTTPVTFTGTVVDVDGCYDVSLDGDISGVFYRSDQGESCSPNDSRCYPFTRSSCSMSGCDSESDKSFNFTCSVELQYFASSTTSGDYADEEWIAHIEISDSSLLSVEEDVSTEVNALLALSLDASVDYGQMDLESTSDAQSITIQNTGNSGIDVNLSVDGDMICDGEGSSAIPAANVTYSDDEAFLWEEGTPLSTSVTELELDLAEQVNPNNDKTSSIYLRLKLPESGVRGFCQNTLTITAKADEENGW